MKPAAILAGSMAIPAELVDMAALKRALSVSYLPMGVQEPLTLDMLDTVGGLVLVPRQFGLNYCRTNGIEYTDQTSVGKPVKFPKAPKPRDYQVEPLLRLQEACGGFYDFIFRARTGWGKTVGSLILAQRIGTTTLVLVDQENLKDQWVRALVEQFGFAREDIGIIQGKECSYHGKAVTIAMVQTLRGKQGDDLLFQYFGLLIVDEVHVIGAPTFSTVLPRINAAYRIGVSATPKRRDGLQKVLDYHLGKVRVYIDDEHEESSVYVMQHGSVYSWFANTSPKIGRFITEVSEDGSRNLLIAQAACHLYETGRDVLVLSDRIEHLRSLMDLCFYLGVGQDEMGLYAGYHPAYGYDKDATPAKRPAGYQRNTEYTPVSLQLISKRIAKKSLESTKNAAKILFATYGMFAKGVDVPRLSGGVDATPRSQAEQVHGRVLRKVAGKKKPIWITIVDSYSYRSLYSLSSRISGYLTNNAVLFEGDLEKGWTECNATDLKARMQAEVARLKSMRIETNSAGLNTLLTQGQVMQAVKQRAKSTIAKVARRDPPRSLPMGSSRAGKSEK